MENPSEVDWKKLKSDNTVTLSEPVLRASGFKTGDELQIFAVNGCIEIRRKKG